MAWHYYDESGKKIGPLQDRELKRLARQGTVSPETRVEAPDGRAALAKNVKGLTFHEATPSDHDPFSATVSVAEDTSVTPDPRFL
jgi:hypothetical protein